jgi:HD-GYP domain-containing protein (c-di-GMP phosphodiesterase class II)
MLHDIGKVGVPSEILLKPGPLTDEEWVAMRSHAAVGGELVRRIDAFARLAPAVRASHGRWDGEGYPDGLAGEEIPLAARIIAACDTYDAIVTDRPIAGHARPRRRARSWAGWPARSSIRAPWRPSCRSSSARCERRWL